MSPDFAPGTLIDGRYKLFGADEWYRQLALSLYLERAPGATVERFEAAWPYLSELTEFLYDRVPPVAIIDSGVMRSHPELGFDALQTAPGLQPEMLDMVLHHHEYLDGSGYPHGLHANENSDLVRIITIAAIFNQSQERDWFED